MTTIYLQSDIEEEKKKEVLRFLRHNVRTINSTESNPGIIRLFGLGLFYYLWMTWTDGDSILFVYDNVDYWLTGVIPTPSEVITEKTWECHYMEEDILIEPLDDDNILRNANCNI